jgi:23S rRNA pseudouridine1911/1915/1917 synthase
LPTIAEKEIELFHIEKELNKRQKYFYQCPSCSSYVSPQKFESHLYRCAKDLLPRGPWPGAQMALEHARALEKQVRHDVIKLRFVDKLSLEDTAKDLKLSKRRIKYVIKMSSKIIPLVIDSPSSDIISVLYEDEDILAVNKPPRINHHPAHRWVGGSLLNSVLGHVQENFGDPTTVGPITRLDRDTSGVCVFAKTKAAASVMGQILSTQKQEQTEYWNMPSHSFKEYLTLTEPVRSSVSRCPLMDDIAIGDEFVISKSLGVGPKRVNAPPKTLIMSEFDGGKKARTTFRLMDRSSQGHELLLCTLDTGRSHQIRVHLQSAGRSVLGDPFYGKLTASESEFGMMSEDEKTELLLKNTNGAIGRTALHAWRLRFAHPRTFDEIEIVAPLPTDFQKACDAVGVSLPSSK